MFIMKRKAGKIVSLLIAFSMLSGMFMISFGAESNGQDLFPESTKGIWTDYTSDSFAGGTGTQEDPYQIATAEQFAHMAVLINSKANSSDEANQYVCKSYKLISDIDLSSHYWIPIVALGASFGNKGGEFDGNNKNITGLYINTDYIELTDDGRADRVGLFGSVYENSVIKNLNITSGTIKNTLTVIAQKYDESTKLIQTKGSSVGSIAGRVKVTSEDPAKITSCSSNVNIIFSEDNPEDSSIGFDKPSIGGLVGSTESYNTFVLDSCHNYGSITILDSKSENSVGGIVGRVGSQIDMTESSNNGDITVESGVPCNAGGIVGEAGSVLNAYGCYNTGNITGKSSSQKTGGIVGYKMNWVDENEQSENYYINLTACYNLGDLEGDFVGGLIGYSENRAELVSCYSSAKLTKTEVNIDDSSDNMLQGLFSLLGFGQDSSSDVDDGAIGGIAGQLNSLTATSCYYDRVKANINKDVGVGGSNVFNGISTLTTDEMKDASNQFVANMNSALSGKGYQYEYTNGVEYPAVVKTTSVSNVSDGASVSGSIFSNMNQGDAMFVGVVTVIAILVIALIAFIIVKRSKRKQSQLTE